MTTTQPPPRRTRPVDRDRVPKKMRKYRAMLTVVGAILMAGGVLVLPFNLGAGRSLLLPVLTFVCGLTITVAAQQPALYLWAEPKPAAPPVAASLATTGQPPESAADPKPQRWGPGIPSARPGPGLDPGFGFIVACTRDLVERKYENVLEKMDEFVGRVIDENEELDDGDRHPYLQAYDLVWSLTKAMPAYSEDVTEEQLHDGDFDLNNPFPLLAELESYHEIAATFAAYMLVRTNEAFTPDHHLSMMQSWAGLGVGLPYRLGVFVYTWDRANGRYMPKQARAAQPRTLKATAAVAQPATGQVPAPRPVPEPAAAPEPAPPPRRAEPDRDDTPAPTLDQLVQVAELVIGAQTANRVAIQQQLGVGEAVAAKLLHRLYQYGVVGEYAGAQPRSVLVAPGDVTQVVAFIRKAEGSGAA